MKNARTFSITDALRFGFTIAIDNIGFFIKLMLLIFGTSLIVLFCTVGIAVLPVISKALEALRHYGIELLSTPAGTEQLMKLLGLTSFLWSHILTGIALKAWSSLLTLGFARIALDFYDMRGSDIKQIFSQWPLIIRNFFATGIAGFAIAAGLVLFIVPGLIIMSIAPFIPFVLVDRNTGIMQTLRECRILTKGSRLLILCTLILMIIINLLVFTFTFGLGLVVTIPASALVVAYMYRKLEALPASAA